MSWFRSSSGGEPAPDAAHPGATVPVPLEQTEPAVQASWRDQIEGALSTTVRTGSAYGAAVVSGAIETAGGALTAASGTAEVVGRAAQGATEAAGRLGRYGAETAGGALTVASGAAIGTAGIVGRAAQGASEVVGQVGRYGVDSAGSALKVAGHAVTGLGRVGGTVIDLAVISPTSAATRTAATVAEAALVKPAKAISRFVIVIVAIICGSAVAIAGFAALAMYFYHAGNTPHLIPSAPAPTVIVLQPGQTIAPQVAPKAGFTANASAKD